MRETWPDVFKIWGVTWGKEGKVWVGLAVIDIENPRMALSVESERIIRENGRNVLVDLSMTLDRFGWEEDDITITGPGEEDDR
jgi:hypothetical protein